MNRAISFIVAAAVAVTSAATSFVPAQAMPRVAPATIGDGQGVEIQQVARRDRRWRKRYRVRHRGDYRHYRPRHHVRHHRRARHYVRHHYYPRYHRRHHHHHHYYGSGIGLGVTLGVVGAVVGSGYYGGLSWQEACARKYRSFNWNTGMYLGYDGYWHRCVLP